MNSHHGAKSPVNPSSALQRLQDTKGFIFDMDGTLILGDKQGKGFHVLPGAIDILKHLRRQAIPFVVFTNGSGKAPEDYAHQLRGAGLDVQDNEMMTPATSAADIFQSKNYQRIMVLGGEGMIRPLRQAGIETVASRGKEKVDGVFAGWFREFGIEDLEAAYYAVAEGANFYSASQTRFFAAADGKALVTSRVIAAMMQDISGCEIHIVGKPALAALESASRRLGVEVEQVAVVGDDPELEVPMAHNGNALAIAVSTGIAGREAYQHLPASQQPHLHLDNVADLLKLL